MPGQSWPEVEKVMTWVTSSRLPPVCQRLLRCAVRQHGAVLLPELHSLRQRGLRRVREAWVRCALLGVSCEVPLADAARVGCTREYAATHP